MVEQRSARRREKLAPAAGNTTTEEMASGNSVNKLNGLGLYGQFLCTIWKPFITFSARSSVVTFVFFSLLVVAFFSARFHDSPLIFDNSVRQTILAVRIIRNNTEHYPHPQQKPQKQPPVWIPPKDNDTHPHNKMTRPKDNDTHPHNKMARPKDNDTHLHNKMDRTTKTAPKKIKVPLTCPANTTTHTCPTNYPKKLLLDPDAPPPSICPDYFRWMYEDLQPWRKTGITREMVERAKRTANFRLVISDGRAYVERYQKSYQTRDVFTLWGILQLLRKYPGRVPDLELMFDCVDWPVILSRYFRGPKAPAPPPLFRYCGDDKSLDIAFPDWSFWGWPEINIKPWETLSKELKEGNKRVKWTEREPYAYWKGNPFVAPTRMDLLKCNVSDTQDWHARVYIQDWGKEIHEGFKESDLASQCIHRYKIYIEGSAWSVSEKYILACDSVGLIVKPRYYDFFSRGLIPIHHYWPIKDEDKCKSIKYAVEWSESHKGKAQAIGKAASEFIQEDLKIDFVYDYMLYLLTEYAKLLKFKPTIPRNAVELCSEAMACPAQGLEKKFMMESMVMGPSDRGPCTMPPPYDPVALQVLQRRKTNAIRQVEKWENDYWDNQTHYHH